MPFEKGKEKTGGRKVGTPNKKTAQWEELGQMLIDQGAERVKEIMENSDDKTFMFYYSQFIEYFRPKQSRAEIKADVNIEKPLQKITLPGGEVIEI